MGYVREIPGASAASPCMTCRHYRGTGRFTGAPHCKAFRQAIPGKILSGWIDHRKPVAGDGGVRFEAGEHFEYT